MKQTVKYKQILAHICLYSMVLQNLVFVPIGHAGDTGEILDSRIKTQQELFPQNHKDIISQEIQIPKISNEAEIANDIDFIEGLGAFLEEDKKQGSTKPVSKTKVLESEKLDYVNSQKSTKDTYSKEKIIVKYKEGKSISGRIQIRNSIKNEGISGIKMETLNSLDIGVISMWKEIQNIEKTVKDLNSLPHIEYAELDYALSRQDLTWVQSSDPRSIEQWHLRSISAESAWEVYDDTSSQSIVSIIDTWVDYLHPDLVGNLQDLSSECRSYTGAVISSWCPNHGRNFEDGFFTLFDRDETFDISGHGTHISGVIWATRDNNIGGAGVTQNAKLIQARTDTYNALFQTFFVSDSIKALDFAIQNNTKVVNASYGGTSFSQAAHDSIDRARQEWILFVAAAWNNGEDNDSVAFYPANYDLDNIISVAALSANDTLPAYSNYWANQVDIAAPGWDITNDETGEGGILSTYPGQQTVFLEDFETGSWFTVTGTGSDWYLYGWGVGIHTQEPLFYTGGVDSILTFNDVFSLDWATAWTVEWVVSCSFWSFGIFDSDFWDEINFFIHDRDLGTDRFVGGAFTSDPWTASDFRFKIPFTDPTLMRDNLQLRVQFFTDQDDDVGTWCLLDDIEVISHNKDNHGYKFIQGTSFAAPIVAWAAAMVWSYNPEMGYQEVKDILLTSGDDIWLQSQILTGRKVNLNTSIQETINRYGIIQSGNFIWSSFSAPVIDLDDKSISLSGSTIQLQSTGTSINLQNNASIEWNGEIHISTGSELLSGTGQILATSEDFDVFFYDSYNQNITSEDQVVYGQWVYLSYTGALSGTGVQIQIGDIYQGEIQQDLFIPLEESFSGSLQYRVYADWDTLDRVSSGIEVQVLQGSTPSIDFRESEEHFEVEITPSQVEVWQRADIQITAIGLDGNTLEWYTWSINISSGTDSGVVFSSELWGSPYVFQASDNGQRLFEDSVEFSSEGLHSISVNDTDNTEIQWSTTLQVGTRVFPIVSITWENTISNTQTQTLTLNSSEYPISYNIEWDINTDISGSTTQAIEVQVELSGVSGEKDINFSATDTDGNTATGTTRITLDQELPEININSHQTDQAVSGDNIVIAWTVFDTYWVETLSIGWNSVEISWSGSWSQQLGINGWENTIPYILSDTASNILTGSLNIIRVPEVTAISTQDIWPNSGVIQFQTDLESIWEVIYGTQSWNLNQNISSQNTQTDHNILIPGLSPSTKYYYSVRWNLWTHTWSYSEVQEFSTIEVDTTPDIFELPEIQGVGLSQQVPSNPVNISGINTPTIIQIQNGEYRVNQWEWTNQEWTIQNQDTLEIRTLSASEYTRSNTATFQVGGVSFSFVVTTRQASLSRGGRPSKTFATPKRQTRKTSASVENSTKAKKESTTSSSPQRNTITKPQEKTTLSEPKKEELDYQLLQESEKIQDMFLSNVEDYKKLDTILNHMKYLSSDIQELQSDLQGEYQNWKHDLETYDETTPTKILIMRHRENIETLKEYSQRVLSLWDIQIKKIDWAPLWYIHYPEGSVGIVQQKFRENYKTNSREKQQKVEQFLYLLHKIELLENTSPEKKELQKQARTLFQREIKTLEVLEWKRKKSTSTHPATTPKQKDTTKDRRKDSKNIELSPVEENRLRTKKSISELISI